MNITNDLGLFVYLEDPIRNPHSRMLAAYPYATQLCMEAIRAGLPTDPILDAESFYRYEKDQILKTAEYFSQRPKKVPAFYQDMQRAALYVKGDFAHERMHLSVIRGDFTGLSFHFNKPRFPAGSYSEILPPDWLSAEQKHIWRPPPNLLIVHSLHGGHLMIEIGNSQLSRTPILKVVDAGDVPQYLKRQLSKLSANKALQQIREQLNKPGPGEFLPGKGMRP